MSKRKKKRNKPYQGQDAKQPSASSGPVVHRYQAVERGAISEWWQTRKKVIKPLGIVVAILAFVTWLIVELIRALI